MWRCPFDTDHRPGLDKNSLTTATDSSSNPTYTTPEWKDRCQRILHRSGRTDVNIHYTGVEGHTSTYTTTEWKDTRQRTPHRSGRTDVNVHHTGVEGHTSTYTTLEWKDTRQRTPHWSGRAHVNVHYTGVEGHTSTYTTPEWKATRQRTLHRSGRTDINLHHTGVEGHTSTYTTPEWKATRQRTLHRSGRALEPTGSFFIGGSKRNIKKSPPVAVSLIHDGTLDERHTPDQLKVGFQTTTLLNDVFARAKTHIPNREQIVLRLLLLTNTQMYWQRTTLISVNSPSYTIT